MGIPSPPAILLPDLSVVTPHLNDAERLQGLPEGWTDVPHHEEGRTFNKRRRWTLIGNAVNAEVSQWLGEQMVLNRPYDGDPGRPLQAGKSWPAAAWFDGRIRYEVSLGTWPVSKSRTSLVEFLNHSGSPLSLRASVGFYKRICQSSLRFKPGFKEAIAAHIRRMDTGADKQLMFGRELSLPTIQAA